MSLENDFLPFATGVGANVPTQSAYAGNAAVTSGVASGIASSALSNKTWRQGSIAAYLIGNLINNEANQTALDNGDLTTLYNNFVSALASVANTLAAPTVPGGRMTLSSGTPAMSGTVTGASAVIYTPYLSNRVPVWNGSSFIATVFAEISQLLSDTTLSPSGAIANAFYDLFVWSNSGTIVVSRGPAWTNATTRAAGLSRVQGILVNASGITNGPAAGYGVFVGSIMTDPAGATVSFNPTPAAAATGPSGGAWIGLWNYYNRLPIMAIAQDSTAKWTYASATWRQAAGSTNNQITFMSGFNEDFIEAHYQVFAASATNAGFVGIGLDSITVATIATGMGANAGSAVPVQYRGQPVLGQHYFAAMEATDGTQVSYGNAQSVPSSTVTAQMMQLSAQLRY